MKKSLKILGLIVLVISVYFIGRLCWFAYKEQALVDQVADNLFGKVLLITSNGLSYRDLNKNGLLDIYETPEASIDARVNDLLAQMTVAEKAGLMFHSVISMGNKGAVGTEGLSGALLTLALGNPKTAIAVRHINHFNLTNSGSIDDLASWQNAVQKLAEKTRLGIPVTISSDPRHSFTDVGLATGVSSDGFSRWPEQLGFGAIDDTAITEQFGRIANAEYRAIGIRVALHPMADLATEPRWSRIIGTFGEDAGVAARQTAAYVRGFQGEKIDRQSVITMTKHFSGAGPQEDGEDAHFFDGRNQIYPGNNFSYHLKPFEAALRAGTGQIMPYYGIPVGQTSEEVGFAFNKDIITTLLREKYGFDGVVCADWNIITSAGAWGHYGLVIHRGWGVDNLSVKQRFKKAIDAGMDQFGGERFPEPLVELVESGEITEQRIDQSVRRLLRDKFRLGLFDNPYIDVDTAALKVGLPEYVAAGKHAMRISQVLLKNAQSENGLPVLPLIQGSKIYIENIDPLVASRYGSVVATPEEADFGILRLQTAARNPKLRSSVIETLMDSYFRQGDLDFKGEEMEGIVDIMNRVPTIVNIYLDRPAVIPEISKQSVALLGNFGADDAAILDVIFGLAEPRGKLPFELPSSMDAVIGQKEDVPYDSKDPLYAFGFGLHYSTEE